MSSRYWSGTIGATELLDGGDVAGFELKGAEAFEDTFTGNSTPSLNGFVNTQYEERLYGAILELEFLHIPQTLARTLLDSLKPPALALGSSLECTFEDGFQTINGMFKPNVPAWYERGNPDGAYIERFILRLIYTGAVAP